MSPQVIKFTQKTEEKNGNNPNGWHASTPIIAGTAYVMAGDKKEFISADCTHYLAKLIEVVREALKL